MITIVDYGLGNLKSIENMLTKLGVDVRISGVPTDIASADKIILPGVGNFGYGIQQLVSSNLLDELNDFACIKKRPVLGICLGAQMLGRGSDEAPEAKGLGWIDMYCRRFPRAEEFRVPHMGWNRIKLVGDCPLFLDEKVEHRFYFVHSYYMCCKTPGNIVAQTTYGISFTSVVSNDNIFGTQFHPEKSHRHGLALMKAFSEL